MSYKALIFDLDGTLVSTRTDLANAVNYARVQMGFAPLDTEVVVGYVGEGLTRLLERAFEGRKELVGPAREHFSRHYAEHLVDNSPLYDGVAEGLAELAALGARMAVLTNKGEGFSRAILDHHGLSRFMADVVGGDTLGAIKPSPEGAMRLLGALGATPEAALMVGDHHTDLATATATGMASVFCEYGFGDRRGLQSDYDAHRFADVVEIFRRG